MLIESLLMVSLEDKKIKLNDIVYPIVGFAVYFATPYGLATSVDEAVKCCEDMGVKPGLNIKPVPVALTDAENVFEII